MFKRWRVIYYILCTRLKNVVNVSPLFTNYVKLRSQVSACGLARKSCNHEFICLQYAYSIQRRYKRLLLWRVCIVFPFYLFCCFRFPLVEGRFKFGGEIFPHFVQPALERVQWRCHYHFFRQIVPDIHHSITECVKCQICSVSMFVQFSGVTSSWADT